MQWDDVRVLLLLLRGASMQDAAKRLGVDRSTASRRLQALEEGLGAKLMVRTRDGVRPTAAAERLRAHAERMETEALALEFAARERGQKASGVVRVATTEALAPFLVAEGLLDVRQHHPDLAIELFAGNRSLDLSRGEADVAVRLAKSTDASLRARVVAKMGFGLFASPAYVRARGLPRAAAQLHGHDVLLPSAELAAMPITKWLAARPGIRPVFRSSSMPALVAAAVHGHGVVPLTLAWGDREPGLQRLFAIEELPSQRVWLVTHVRSATEPSIRVTVDRIVSLFARALP